MIPKIIHYCWFGNSEIPEPYNSYISHWKEIMPDYQFVRWDESNCDINANRFVKSAYQNKKWAFVSDYFRLKALYEFGGIYLDTDVQVIKPFNDLLNCSAFLGYIWDCLIGTAVIGCEKGLPLMKEIIKKYEDNKIGYEVPNNHVFTDILLEKDWFTLNGKNLEHRGICIYKKEEFEVPGIFYKGHSIHRLANSWMDNTNCKKSILKELIPYRLRRQIGASKAFRQSPYKSEYIK